MLPNTCFSYVSIFVVVLSFVLVTIATTASDNVATHILNRSRRQVSGKLCPPLNYPNTIVTCVLRNEEVPCNIDVKPGTIARPKCKRFYKPSFQPDYTRLTCLDDGTWDQALFYCTPECGSSNLGLNRIVEGDEANIGAFPWQAAMYYRTDNKGTITWELRCSGSLITDQFVITVAHCVADVVESDLRVVLGKYYRDWNKSEKNEARRTVSKIIYQGDFSKKIYNFDLALLQLDEKVQFGQYILPVCRGFPSGSTYLENKDLYVAGWGQTREGDPTSASDTLQYNSVVVVNQNICSKVAPSVFPTFDKFCTMKDHHAHVSTVQAGDSGGGITTVYDGLHFILGAVSAKSNGYSLFTNFTWPYNVIWIESQMKKYESSFRWDDNGVSEYGNNERGCLLPEASSSRKFCSLAAGCEDCDINDRLCFIPPGSKVYRARVVCAPDYTLRSPYSGGDVAICMNGQWYPELPECLRYQFIPGDPWDKVTWQEARENCANKGTVLATIKSKYEQENFKDAVEKQFKLTAFDPNAVWIGLTDARSEGTFEWVDGSILSPSDFNMWHKGEPSNHDKLEHCVDADACRRPGDFYHWNDNYCSDVQYYICKQIFYPNTTVQRISGVFGKKGSTGSPRYKYIPGNPWKKVSWAEARNNCRARGSQLAIIRTGDQQWSFRKAAAKQFEDTGTTPSSIWIGLYGQNEVSDVRLFNWEDGSVHNAWRLCPYSNWVNGLPSTNLNKNCVEALAGTSLTDINPNGTIYQWNNAICEIEKYYFCSIKL